MRFAAAALALVPAVLAAPTTLHKHHARQSCSNPSSNASCMDLVTSCVNSGVNWSNPWNSRICTVAATCAGVGNLLAFARCRGSTVQAPNTLPNLDYNVYASVVGNCAWAPGGCPITPQNYIDFVYSQIVSAWPPSGAWVVSNWWNPIASWAAFPDGRIPYTNFNDWLHWSSTLPPPGNGGGGNPGTGPLQGVQTTCHHDVSLSFDDGPYTWNDDLRNLFNNNNAKTTFFVNGNNYGCIYSEENVVNLRLAYEAGHTIASHTWSHANIAGLNNAQLATEIDLLETALWKILGIKPALIRPPYGSYNQGNIDYLNSRGYTVVTWDVDTGDALGASVGDSMNTVRSQATGHSMILMHETRDSTVFDLAPQVIGHVRNSLGAGLVTVDQCLDISPYQAVGSYGTRDSTWVC